MRKFWYNMFRNKKRGKAVSNIQADAIRVAYDDRVIIDSLSTAIPEGNITTIIGSNG